jgi:hypothetical protein
MGHHAASFTLERDGHLLPRDRPGFVNRLDHLAPAGTPGAPATGTTVSPRVAEIENANVSQAFS